MEQLDQWYTLKRIPNHCPLNRVIFFNKILYIYSYLITYLFMRGSLQVKYKEMALHQRTNLTRLEA